MPSQVGAGDKGESGQYQASNNSRIEAAPAAFSRP